MNDDYFVVCWILSGNFFKRVSKCLECFIVGAEKQCFSSGRSQVGMATTLKKTTSWEASDEFFSIFFFSP